ncbi:MAG: hypothetical protein EOP04_10280 [Proteobacteria bacterium]|nr:MAG: hypothetical protein EOP04_10280 [Pseudomonadota bacterium]
MLMLVLTIVFTKIGRDKDPLYPLYVLSGILCWNVFSQGLLNGAHSIHSNGGLLKKVKVPQWVFPSVAILSALVNLIFALVPFIAVSFFVGLKLHFSLLFLPILLLLFFIFLLGIGLVVGTLNVMFRDIGHMLESGMLILFYSAPIAYPLSLVPERFQVFLHFHPVFYFLKGFRTVLCAYTFESFDWLMMVILSASALGLGLFTHSKLKNRLFYYL